MHYLYEIVDLLEENGELTARVAYLQEDCDRLRDRNGELRAELAGLRKDADLLTEIFVEVLTDKVRNAVDLDWCNCRLEEVLEILEKVGTEAADAEEKLFRITHIIMGG
jgi:chromosome segregation ATPase